MLRTGEVEVRFLLHRGGAIAELSFPRVGPYPLAGTIPHGSFDSIAYTPDFYTGHVVAVAETSEKTTDLTRVSKFDLSKNGSVCSTAVYRTKTALGEWTKIYRAYHHHARLDIVHELRFREARVRSLRLGTLTVLPDAFDRETLGYSTVNGGAVPEHFRLMRGQEIGQHRAPSPQVSASSCLGATEGWVSVGDARSGIAVIADRSLAAAVPMLEFADVDDRFFLRIHHSVAETDETRATFFRGVLRVGFSVVGHRDEISTVRRIAGAIERGLAYRTESGCGIASSI